VKKGTGYFSHYLKKKTGYSLWRAGSFLASPLLTPLIASHTAVDPAYAKTFLLPLRCSTFKFLPDRVGYF
jgi:hypothetical protein